MGNFVESGLFKVAGISMANFNLFLSIHQTTSNTVYILYTVMTKYEINKSMKLQNI